MRQFDVLVWGDQANGGEPHEPPFTDNALGWFFGNDLNASLAKSDAEWIVFAHESVAVDRAFLNSLAECISGFPMVDAFAPRIHDKASNKFLSGYTLDKRSGLSMLDENAPLRYAAAPHPYLSAFSRRIIQRTGRFDELSQHAQFVDYALRMLHAGGKMFSVPYLVADACDGAEIPAAGEPLCASPAEKNDLAYALVKAFGVPFNTRFLLKNPKAARSIWKRRKELFAMRDKATLLSKFKKADFAELF